MNVAEAPGVTRDERLAFLIEEHDGEHLIVDEAARVSPTRLEERTEIEDRGELDRDFVEDLEGLRLTSYAGVEAGVLD